MDAALLAAPLLGLVLAGATHLVPPRAQRTVTIVGDLHSLRDGELSVSFEGAGAGRFDLIGVFDLALEERRLGWPLVSGDEVTRATLTFRWLQPQHFASRQAEARIVLEEQLRSLPGGSYARAVRDGRTSRTLLLPQLLGNALVWWVGLSILLPLIVQAMRLIAWLVGTQGRIRRWRRRRSGCCAECGFDVRGSVWSAHCPECGALLE